MLKIEWAEKAKEQYHNTLQFWINHNKSNEYSLKIVDEVEKKTTHIQNFPKSGIPVNYKNVFRVNFLKYFTMIYEIQDSIIYIIAFWDGRRNPDEIEL